MMKALDSDDKEITYSDYIDTKNFLNCFQYLNTAIKYYKDRLNIY